YFYAAKLALQKALKDKESERMLARLLDMLEQQKKESSNNDAFSNDLVASAYIEEFALKVFSNADRDEQSGKHSKEVAKAFMASTCFFEVLKVFGPLDEGVMTIEKQRYAKFKALQVLKSSKTVSGEHATPSSPRAEDPTPIEKMAPLHESKQELPTSKSSADASFTPLQEGGPSSSHCDFEKAIKHARHAISALQYEDVANARLNLEKALSVLNASR
ncbi:hypothetical protein HDU67_007523, partial [Dinochytrium kinnereticum]